MALDSLCMAALAQELRAALLGARVDKVSQPGRFEVVLALHAARDNVKLLLCAEPGRARAHITEVNRENPAQPPVFCMLLRKHLAGGRLQAIVQPDGERILRFVFDCVNDLGDSVERCLILEAMGAQANLILTDEADRVLCCARRVEGDLAAGKRQVMPGLFYRPPEPHPGLPPLIARELEFRGRDPQTGAAELLADIQAGRYTPTLLLEAGRPKDFSFLPVLHYGLGVESRPYESFGRLLDDFYAADRTRSARQRGSELLKTVKSLRERTARKVANQSRELAQARDREGLRLRGDLLTSNLYRLQKGLSSVRLENFYDPAGGELEVALDPLLTPQQNAAKYYKDYAKAKTAEEALTAQIAKGEADLQYLDSVVESILLAEGDRDLLELRAELEAEGFLRRAKNAKKVMKASAKPLEFTTTAGLRVAVGKTGSQNDRLTTKLAGKGDLWFHAQKTHGAHVILFLDGAQPDPQSVLEAAQLAAWYSQAREGGAKLAVDYTPVRFVKKPSGAKPGMVVYTTYQTVLVEPKPLSKRPHLSS